MPKLSITPSLRFSTMLPNSLARVSACSVYVAPLTRQLTSASPPIENPFWRAWIV